MDDPGWSWPAWKFGMKREELFTKLHDQYNTFPSSIQDPEAFHHDVYEISHVASTPAEFHQLLADRKDQRLRELNEGLESASLEIIANPKLIGTQQWQYALQLFRTKSLDSLVRYFSSYLPEGHPWRQFEDDAQTTSTTSSISDSLADSEDSVSTSSSKPFFDDDDREYLTHEPLTIHTTIKASHLPPSPRSLTACSDSSAASPIDEAHHDYSLSALTPARSMSFSENESDVMIRSSLLSHDDFIEDFDATSQSNDLDTPFTPDADVTEERDELDYLEAQDESITPAARDGFAEESTESETPTPRVLDAAGADSYMMLSRKSTTSSTKTSSYTSSSPAQARALQEHVRSSRKSKKDSSPVRTGRAVRRTSPEEGRIHKLSPDPVRVRPIGRRRHDL
ncbi:hypothetical protein BX600DRAFT_447405 [Xylariales sp. PMI_506]|nr:hypothetical protein BX600DRAFT_447405 [Xylariales sp. PMI_506]